MDERMPPSAYIQYSPSGVHSSPHHFMRPSAAALERERYLAELLDERRKLGAFLRVLPFCGRLLDQEIVRVSSFASNQNFVGSEGIDHGSPLRRTGYSLNGTAMDLEGWSGMQTEENGYLQRMGFLQAPSAGWNKAPGVAASPTVKKAMRLDVPVDKFPNYNFVGRLLGPRGLSLKRVEETTGCRVFIRGRGSVKDSVKEEKMRGKPGYEHLSEPLHVIVEADHPPDMVDARLNQAVGIVEQLLQPMDESTDFYKKQQLRELAMLNGTLREESPRMSPSLSPFNSTGMKRAKTGR